MGPGGAIDWQLRTARTPGLPTLPTTLVRVLEVANDPNCSAEEIAAAISWDPALSSKVLALVNSAYVGLVQQVGSLQQATALVGVARVRSLAFSASLDTLLPPVKRRAAFDRTEFWRHLLGTALVARCWARDVPSVDREEAYMAGLLHDIGKLLLDLQSHAAYARIVKDAREAQCPLWRQERAGLQIDHARAGAMLLEHWGLPDRLVAAAKRHHSPPQADVPPMTALACAANHACARHGYGASGDPVLPPVTDSVRQALGFDPTDDATVGNDIQGILGQAEGLVAIIMA